MSKKVKSTKYFIPTLLLATTFLVITVAATNSVFQKLQSEVGTKQAKTAPKWQHVGDIYKTIWTYSTPSGKEDKIGFTLTLEGDIIKGIEVQVLTQSTTSIEYQSNFAKELPKVVIGKKLSEIASLDRVSGASGTTKNFKDAIAEIAKQLKS